MQPLIKKVVKCPDKNKFVLRTATRGASFLQCIKKAARYVAAYHYAQGKIVDRKMTVKVYDQWDKLLDTVELYL